MEFVRLLGRLVNRTSLGQSIILVEGVRDRAALVALGIPSGSIRLVNRGSSLVRLSESLARDGRPVIVLTDWDSTGARLATRLTEMLKSSGVCVDTETRRKIAHAVCREVLEVENLRVWAERESEVHREPLPQVQGAPRA